MLFILVHLFLIRGAVTITFWNVFANHLIYLLNVFFMFIHLLFVFWFFELQIVPRLHQTRINSVLVIEAPLAKRIEPVEPAFFVLLEMFLTFIGPIAHHFFENGKWMVFEFFLQLLIEEWSKYHIVLQNLWVKNFANKNAVLFSVFSLGPDVGVSDGFVRARC